MKHCLADRGRCSKFFKMALIISNDDAKRYYSDFLYKKGSKGATFENAQIILKSKNVEIREKPLDVEEAKNWKSEKDKLVHNFDRIIQGKKKKEGRKEYNMLL